MEVAILIGLQASGKTTFYRRHLAATHDHVSKDNFPNARKPQKRQLRMISAALSEGRNVAVDNTNPAPAQWAPLIQVARDFGASVVGYWFPIDVAASIARNAARPEPVPDVGLFATLGLLRRPTLSDGFDRLYSVRISDTDDFTVTETTTCQ
ncbi:ATP-binding protein [Kibdelosporangium persicum]|uniref:Kinase n=1 Tax=Kibdelosporangium persicum TaxID=2698649 RepID=A0ABX2F5R2_9PSEU|nr:ATP-binding protein [Kibdelosporangium persicum]NRN66701.1 putative kinase [Kibdelosporangium persicum]